MSQSKSLMPVIIAVSMVSAIGGIVFNTMIVMLPAASKAFGIDEIGVGKLFQIAGLGYLVGTISAPFWVDRVNWKLTAFLASFFAIAAFYFGSFATRETVFAVFGIYGFACAIAIGLATRVLADMPNLERAYGTRLAVELTSIGVFSFILRDYFIANEGFSGAMIGLTIFAFLLGLGAFLFPKRPEFSKNKPVIPYPKFSESWRAWVMIGIFLVYLMVNVALFGIIEFNGAKFNPTDRQNAILVTGLKFLGGLAGAGGAIVGIRAGLKFPHYAAFVILVLGTIGMMSASRFDIYMVSSWVWEMGFTLGCLYVTTAVTRFDPSKKLVVLIPATFGLSLVFGGGLVGLLTKDGNPGPLYLAVIGASIIPSLFILMTRNPHIAEAVNE